MLLLDCWATEVLTLFSPPPSHDCRITLSQLCGQSLLVSSRSEGSHQDLGQQMRIVGGKCDARTMQCGIWTGHVRVLLQAREAAAPGFGAQWAGSDSVRCLRCTWCLGFCGLNPTTSMICSFSGTCRCYLPEFYLLLGQNFTFRPGGHTGSCSSQAEKLLAFSNFIWIAC